MFFFELCTPPGTLLTFRMLYLSTTVPQVATYPYRGVGGVLISLPYAVSP